MGGVELKSDEVDLLFVIGEKGANGAEPEAEGEQREQEEKEQDTTRLVTWDQQLGTPWLPMNIGHPHTGVKEPEVVCL